jgi:hypothetical protein
MTSKERAAKISAFLQWANALSIDDGVLVPFEIVEWIKLAGEDLRYYIALEAERSKRARETGKKGGRPPMKRPSKLTIYQRQRRARRKAEAEGKKKQ